MTRPTPARAAVLPVRTTRCLTALRFAALATLALALLGACATERPVASRGDGALVIEGVSATVVGEGPFVAGAMAEVRFANAGADRWWYNPCTRTVERRNGPNWVSVDEEWRACRGIVYELGTGGEETHRVDVPSDAAPGTYRFRFHLMSQQTDGPSVRVPSTSFEVQ